MDDEADLKKMIEVLNRSKQNKSENIDFDDFIDSEESESENEENDYGVSVDDELLNNLEPFDVFSIYKHDPISSLKPEEKNIIDSCEDSDLKELLFLNRKKNINLILLYKNLQDLLMECRQYIIEKASLLKEHINTLKVNHQSGAAWRLAAPYFKDKQLYQCPLNEDTLKKKRNNELFVYDLWPIHKWSSFECEKIIKAVKLSYTFNKQKCVKAKVEKTAKEYFQQLKERICDTEINQQLEIPPLNSNEHITWSRIASVFSQDKRSEFECKAMWHLYLHPSINKSPWTTPENENLKSIAKMYRYQNWKQIALKLGTNRSELSVCKHYFSNLSQKYKKGEFTYWEDKKLLDAVNKIKIGNFIQWSKVTKQFKNRSRGQLHHRYTYYLSQDMKKTGKFSKAEDILLMICVDKFGRNFKKCSEFIPDRSMIQLKARFVNNLQHTVRKANWTVEEDERIMAHVEKYGPILWSRLAHITLRSRGQLRQRYGRIRNYLDANPNMLLVNVPRRSKPKTEEDESDALCRLIADKYSGTQEIPTLSQIEKDLKTENLAYLISDEDEEEDAKEDDAEKKGETFGFMNNLQEVKTEKEVDGLLLDFFSNSYKIPKVKVIDPLEYDKGIEEVEKVLKYLQVNICIPENLDNIPQLDSLDIRILQSLSSRINLQNKHLTLDQQYDGIHELIPPNLNSVVGLRSLLIKHLHYKHKKREISQLATNIKNPFSQLRQSVTNDILSCSLNDRINIEAERNLFYLRFHSLFKWPAIISLQNPSPELLNISDFLPEKKLTQVKRTYSRISNQENNEYCKKLKRTVVHTEHNNIIKLTPVSNKSVIQDLMKNKSKKLFTVNNINKNGQVKTVINEIKLEFADSKVGKSNINSQKNKPESTSVFPEVTEQKKTVCIEIDDDSKRTPVPKDVKPKIESSDIDALLEDEDVYDLEKLNIFLKGEANYGSDSDNDMLA